MIGFWFNKNVKKEKEKIYKEFNNYNIFSYFNINYNKWNDNLDQNILNPESDHYYNESNNIFNNCNNNVNPYSSNVSINYKHGGDVVIDIPIIK